MQERSSRRAASVVGMAVIGSRVLGLVREQVFAAMFGAGKLLDAFLAAFQIPNLLRDLFAEGALSTAFTSVFAKLHEKRGDEPAWRLGALLLVTTGLVLGGVCLLGILASPLLVQLTSFGFHSVPGKFEVTVELTRVLFPFILFVSLAAVVMGMLNARYVFGLPASASTVFNFVSIVGGVMLAYAFDAPADWRHPEFTTRALYGVSLAVLAGGLAQLLIQLPSLWRLGFRMRWRLEFRDPDLRQVWALMVPTLIAGAAVQVNVLVNGLFASEINGARSWLNCAFRLMQFPIGVFGVAVATVTLPAVARHHARSDRAAFGRTVEGSLRLAFFLTVPAAVGLFALAPHIIRLIYEHGKFDAADTVRTAAALRAYAVGLAGYAGIKVLAPCFTALDKPKIPQRVSLLGIGVNLALNLALVKALRFGHVGLAATTSLVALANFAQLLVYLRRESVDVGRWGTWFVELRRIGLAALLCGLAAYLAAESVRGWGGDTDWANAGAVLVGCAVGAGSYGLVALWLRLPEPVALVQFFRARLAKRG
jgi:putative peptidoglycan lipid II flippase